MTINEQAKKFYEEKVTRAIDELIAEYNGREDHWACEYDGLFEAESGRAAESHGLLVIFPGGEESRALVSWTEDTDYVTIASIWASISETLSFQHADVVILKESIRWMLEKKGLGLNKAAV